MTLHLELWQSAIKTLCWKKKILIGEQWHRRNHTKSEGDLVVEACMRTCQAEGVTSELVILEYLGDDLQKRVRYGKKK
jgi:hypothetical protein